MVWAGGWLKVLKHSDTAHEARHKAVDLYAVTEISTYQVISGDTTKKEISDFIIFGTTTRYPKFTGSHGVLIVMILSFSYVACPLPCFRLFAPFCGMPST